MCTFVFMFMYKYGNTTIRHVKRNRLSSFLAASRPNSIQPSPHPRLSLSSFPPSLPSSLGYVRYVCASAWQDTGACSQQDDHRHRIITYLTDVEGDASYLDRYIRESKVLRFRTVPPRLDKENKDDYTYTYFPYDRCIEFVTKNSVLVYGGDVWDRGGHDLYVIRQLLDLRNREGPDRVYFIMGNRDVNKMRILQEMGLEGQRNLPVHKGTYWLRKSGLQGDPLLFDCNNSEQPSKVVPQTNAAERLKWMLSQTMGSPQAFELRKLELQTEQRQYSGQEAFLASDEDVVESYRQSCHPVTGEMGRYLSQASMALRCGKVMFVHGALPLTKEVLQNAMEQKPGSLPPMEKECGTNTSDSGSSLFHSVMPWRDPSSNDSTTNKVHNAKEWIEALNKFSKAHLEAWTQNITDQESSIQDKNDLDISNNDEPWSTLGGYPHWTSDQKDNSYGALMQYGMGWTPDGKRNPTVVYSSWLSNGMPNRFCADIQTKEDAMFAKLTSNFFQDAGLQLIVSGHQPHGDMPVPIQVDATLVNGPGSSGNNSKNERTFWILCGDTSYSGDTVWINNKFDSQKKERNNIGRGSGPNGRGDVAVSEVLIKQCIDDGTILGVTCHGVLSDGYRYETTNIISGDSVNNTEDEYGGGNDTTITHCVGRVAPETLVPCMDELSSSFTLDDANTDARWWVKAKFVNGSVLMSTGEGYSVWNTIVDSTKKCLRRPAPCSR